MGEARSVNIKADLEAYLSGKKEEALEDDESNSQKAKNILLALGGAKNISQVEFCAFTRIRLNITTPSLVNEAKLTQQGVLDVMTLQNGFIHLILGSKAEKNAQFLQKYMTAPREGV